MENTEPKEKTIAVVPTVQLTPFEATKETLISLASDYANMVVTRENLKEANEARLVLYRKRIEIQNIAKANRKTIKEFLKNNNDATEEELIGTIEPTELALEAKIKAIKDAIAEEEKIESERISRHKHILESIKSKTVAILNSTDTNWLNQVNNTVLTDLEEFTAEGEQLLSTLKETAKNRLEMLEFQAKKKADEEAAALKLIEEEKAKKEAEALAAEQALQGVQIAELAVMEDIGLAEMAFDADFEEQNKVTENHIYDGSKHDWIKNDEVGQMPTISPFKTVPIGVASEVNKHIENKKRYDALGSSQPIGPFNLPSETKPIVDDKQIMEFINTKIRGLSADIESMPLLTQKAISHKEYLVNMLIKLAAQTIKVSEKL